MFGDNDRISHRQLMRQIILSLLAPFLLCLAGWKDLRGSSGVAGVLAAVVFLSFYVIFLVRLGPACENLSKTMGKLQSRIILSFYLLYILLTAVWLTELISGLAATWLLPEGEVWAIRLSVVVVCAIAACGDMQKRGRMAEVSFLVITGGFFLLILLAFCQGEHFAMERWQVEAPTVRRIAKSAYETICGFLPLTLLPFLLPKVAKAASAGRAVLGAISVLGVFLAAVIVLLPLSLGWSRMEVEAYPVLPLLTGTNLPGDLFARFDVIWLTLLLYGLLFSLGSLFSYGSLLAGEAGFWKSPWILAAAAFLLSCDLPGGFSLSFYYEAYVLKIAAPVLLAVTFYIYIWYRRKQG